VDLEHCSGYAAATIDQDVVSIGTAKALKTQNSFCTALDTANRGKKSMIRVRLEVLLGNSLNPAFNVHDLTVFTHLVCSLMTRIYVAEDILKKTPVSTLEETKDRLLTQAKKIDAAMLTILSGRVVLSPNNHRNFKKVQGYKQEITDHLTDLVKSDEDKLKKLVLAEKALQKSESKLSAAELELQETKAELEEIRLEHQKLEKAFQKNSETKAVLNHVEEGIRSQLFTEQGTIEQLLQSSVTQFIEDSHGEVRIAIGRINLLLSPISRRLNQTLRELHHIPVGINDNLFFEAVKERLIKINQPRPAGFRRALSLPGGTTLPHSRARNRGFGLSASITDGPERSSNGENGSSSSNEENGSSSSNEENTSSSSNEENGASSNNEKWHNARGENGASSSNEEGYTSESLEIARLEGLKAQEAAIAGRTKQGILERNAQEKEARYKRLMNRKTRKKKREFTKNESNKIKRTREEQNNKNTPVPTPMNVPEDMVSKHRSYTRMASNAADND
jgi:hypothetical protein